MFSDYGDYDLSSQASHGKNSHGKISHGKNSMGWKDLKSNLVILLIVFETLGKLF